MAQGSPKICRTRSEINTPQPGQIVHCRGCTWRFLKSENGFWELELIRQGANFSENPVRVWALPYLEQSDLKILDGADAFCPEPQKEQVRKGKLLTPAIKARQRHTIENQLDSREPVTATNCAIDYKEWQFEPWRRVVEQLPFPRLLIADDVGLGKTTEAAIVLAELARRRRADRVLIVAPQHLCEKWQDELFNRFGLAFEIFDRSTRERLSERGIANPWEIVERVIVSMDFAKRWENFKPLSTVEWDVVVIDECHHFVKDDSGSTTRLREFAQKIAYKAPGLILLSATPFTGSKDEFRSLLELLDPKFASINDVKWDPTSPYLVRRLKRDVKKFEEIQDRKIEDLKIGNEDLSKTESAAFDLVKEELLAQRHGSASESWDRLLEEVARKRLSSSWKAFQDTITSDSRLSTWFSAKTKASVKKLVETHDSAKLNRLRSYLDNVFKNEPDAKVVIFTEAISTQEQIAFYLNDKAGYKPHQVACIEGGTGREARLPIEEAFANPNSELKILIATDTLAEGKDLQHACHHLVHFELPWSLVKLEQRAGRIDRLGQRKTPHIANLILDLDATPDQRVMLRLSKKVQSAQATLGSVSPILESTDLNILDLATKKGGAAEADRQIDESIEHLKEFGFDISSTTPLSPAPAFRRNDNAERRTLFDLMLTELGGNLEPNGNSENECLLSLPPGWTIPQLVLNSFGYPSESNKWRVTFDPDHYLKYERHIREGGAVKTALQFMGPVHPLMLQIEARFRNKMSRESYPVFGVKKAPADALVVVELTVRSPSGRVSAQALRTYTLKDRKRIEAQALDVIESAGAPTNLPHLRVWQGLHQFLEAEAKAFAAELESDYKSKRERFVREQRELDPSSPGITERAAWISDLWSIDFGQTQYQICALLLNQ